MGGSVCPFRAPDWGMPPASHMRRTLWVLALTSIVMVLEIAAGWFYGSLALLADGFHMGTHAGALGIAVLAYWYAKRHVDDPAFNFGTGKVGVLAGFASALALAVAAAGIAIESLHRLWVPQEIAYTEALVVAVVGLAVNVISLLLLRDKPDHAHGHHTHDPAIAEVDFGVAPARHSHAGDHNLRAAYVHVLGDALTSILAIIGLIVAALMAWPWVDALVGLVGATVIAAWAWDLLRDTAGILLDRVPSAKLVERITALVSAQGASVRDLHLWQIAAQRHALILQIDDPQGRSAAAWRILLGEIRTLAHITVER